MENMIIINLKSGPWWKKDMTYKKINLNSNIPAGIYLIDKYHCQKNIELGYNNKTNSLIDSKNLFLMLKNSKKNNMFIELPVVKTIYKFNILTALIK